MLVVRIKGQCDKDIKRAHKRGKDLNKFWRVVGHIQKGQILEERHRPHRLTGNWRPFWECHVEPDWLLVYHIENGILYLVRTGTHADLFE